MAYKECTKCHESKPFTHFTINGNRRRAECRECERERSKMEKRAARARLSDARPPPVDVGPCLVAEAFNQWRADTRMLAW